MMLYHVDIEIPRRITKKAPQGLQKAVYSYHAIEASKTDKYGTMYLPPVLNMNNAVIIEAEEYDKTMPLKKLVCRFPYDDKLDMVAVIIPRPKCTLFVKTVWFNGVDDKHSTLDKSRFAAKR